MKSDASFERASILARMLSDPLRLRLLQALMPGPLPVSELVALSGAAQSNVSNHLKTLRESGMVRTDRLGRQVSYEIADGDIAHLVQVLTSVSGIPAEETIPTGSLVAARTCYDHLAGQLGVAVFSALEKHGAIRSDGSPWSAVELGPAASAVLETRLGLDLTDIAAGTGRRRHAFACLDWTSQAPHLGGALGAALLCQCFERGWLERRDDNARAVMLTEAGVADLAWLLDLSSPLGGGGREADEGG